MHKIKSFDNSQSESVEDRALVASSHKIVIVRDRRMNKERINPYGLWEIIVEIALYELSRKTRKR